MPPPPPQLSPITFSKLLIMHFGFMHHIYKSQYSLSDARLIEIFITCSSFQPVYKFCLTTDKMLIV